MRKKIVKVMLMTVMTTSLMMTGVGCGAQESPTEEKVEETTVEVSKDTLKELKKYVPLIDKVKIMEHSKNVDLNKVMNSLIDESKKEEVASLTVDASKVNVEKVGTYGVGITLVTKAPEKATTDKKAEEKQPENQKTEKPQNDKQPESTDNSVIVGNVDVEVVDKDVLPNLKDDVVVEENNKVEVPKPSEKPSKEENKKPSDDKKPEENKKPSSDKKPSENKPSDDKKPEKPNKPTVPSKPTTPSKPTEPSKPQKPAEPKPQAHTHNWVQQYTTVNHEATGHTEQTWVVDTPAWDEPIYGGTYICNVCGANLGTNSKDVIFHTMECGGGYHTEQVQTGNIHHDEVGHYESKWVEDSPAWSEQVANGYKCSGCGATK